MKKLITPLLFLLLAIILYFVGVPLALKYENNKVIDHPENLPIFTAYISFIVGMVGLLWEILVGNNSTETTETEEDAKVTMNLDSNVPPKKENTYVKITDIIFIIFVIIILGVIPFTFYKLQVDNDYKILCNTRVNTKIINKEFDSEWNDYYLVFDRKDNFKKIDFREQNYIMVSKKIYDYKKVGDTFTKQDCEN